MSTTFATFFAQATNAAATGTASMDPNSPAPGGGFPTTILLYLAVFGLVYFTFFRPQSQAKKKQEALIKGAKTGDRIVTTGGIHGVISNVKDSTVMLKVADNVKIEVEKNHIDKVVRESADPVADKVSVTKS